MSEIINWIKESRGNTQGVYICTDWYDHELSYYLGFWPQDIDRMERSLREEIKEWLDHASTYDEGEISISGIYQNGELFSEDWSTDASTLDEPDKVLERIMELVKLTSNPETLPLKKIKEAETSVRKAAQVHGKDINTGAILLFGIRAWYTYDGSAEKQWDLQYLVEV